MISNVALVTASRAHWGKPYAADGGRFGPDHYDCSGHVVASYREAGGGEPGAYVSSEQYRWCRDHGSIVPWSAPFVPGELLFMPNDPLQGISSSGHVCLVDLNVGMTSEARGHAYGVGSWTIASRHWAPLRGRLPGVDYSNAGQPATTRSAHAMLIRNKVNGEIWLLGVGVGHRAASVEEVNQLKFIGVPYTEADPLTVLGWFDKFGAWDRKTNTARTI